MATRIRLARGGSKKRPFYRLVIADKRSPRDGNFIEKVGTFNPLLNDDDKSRFIFNKERIEYWLKTGATPSEKVAILLHNNGFKTVESYLPAKYPKTAKERDELRQKRLDAEAKAKAEKEAAAKAAEEEAKAEEKANAAPAEEAPSTEDKKDEAPKEEAKSEEKKEA